MQIDFDVFVDPSRPMLFAEALDLSQVLEQRGGEEDDAQNEKQVHAGGLNDGKDVQVQIKPHL